MKTQMQFESLEVRDTPAVFTGAGFPTGFQPFPGWNGPVQDSWGDFLGTGGTQVAFTPGAGGGPIVRIFELTAGDGQAGRGWVEEKALFDPSFRGGVDLTTAEQKGSPDLLVAGAGAGGGPVVRVVALNGSIDRSFYAYDSSFRGGVNVDVSDIDANGLPTITTTPGAGGGPLLREFGLDGTMQQQFFIGPVNDQSGDYTIAPAGLAAAAVGVPGAPTPYVIDGPDGTVLYNPLTGITVG